MSPARGTILIVDDDPDVRDALRDTLEDEGYSVVATASGPEALAWLRAHEPPSVILLDWNMTPMNAPKFMEAWSQEPRFAPEVPVVLVTADVHATDKVRTGMYAALITKPVDLDALFDVAERYAAN